MTQLNKGINKSDEKLTSAQIGKTREAAIEVIKAVKGHADVIAVPREFIHYTGTIDSAIFLSQLLYWSDRAKRKDGGVFKTYKDWHLEIGLSEYEVKKSVGILKEKNILTTSIKRANGSPTVHYYLDKEGLLFSLTDFLRDRNSRNRNGNKLEISDSSNLELEDIETNDFLTETSTEITSKITSRESGLSDDNPDSLPNFPFIEEDQPSIEAGFETDEQNDSEEREPTYYEIFWKKQELLVDLGISKTPIKIPDNFEPDYDMVFWSVTRFNDKSIDRATAKFIDYHKSKGTTSCNWKLKWRSWMEHERVPPRSQWTDDYIAELKGDFLRLTEAYNAFEVFMALHCGSPGLVAHERFYEGFPILAKKTVDEILSCCTTGFYADGASHPRLLRTLRRVKGGYYILEAYENFITYKIGVDQSIRELNQDN